MIAGKCILCVNLYVEDCEIIEALKRLVRENPGVFPYVISSGETCSGESRCISICYKLWRDLFGRIPVYFHML